MLRSKLLILKCIDKKYNIVNHMLNYMAFGMCLGSCPTNLSGRKYCDAMNKNKSYIYIIKVDVSKSEYVLFVM